MQSGETAELPTSILALLERTAAIASDSVAIGPLADRFTYERLLEDAAALAGRFRESGMRCLAVCSENTPALTTALFAAAWAGVPYAPMNYRLTDSELRAAAARLAPALTVVGPDSADRLAPTPEQTPDHAPQPQPRTPQDQLHTPLPQPVNARRPAVASQSYEERPLAVDSSVVYGSETAAPHREGGVRSLSVASSEVLADPGGGCPSAEPGDRPADPETIAVLLHTSGTTGPPKSAVLRHRHLVSYVLGTVEFASAGPDEAHLLAVPPYHVASVAAQLSQVYAGRRMVTLARFNPDDWINLAREESVTHVMLVPTMIARIVAALERRGEKMPYVRHVAYGGGKPHRDIVLRALELLPNADFFHAYGLTETSSTVAVLGPEEHRLALAGDPEALRRLASVGRPLPMLEVTVRNRRDTDLGGTRHSKITDSGNEDARNEDARNEDSRSEDDAPNAHEGRDTAPICGETRHGETTCGETGDIWVRGAHVSGEYLETGSTLDSDGWFHTRDRGRFDSDGYLHLLGRNDDMIIRGGENISPGEIEEALLAHPRVNDAAVFAVDSREWGEQAAAAVVATPPLPTVGELKELVRARLRSSRVPARFEFVDELPYSHTGKLLRRMLRERFNANH